MHVWQLRDRQLTIGPRPLVMGIVNVTPDSFSDGGRYLAADAAIAHALRLVQEGADLLDIGGESTRPGSEPVSLDEELRRVTPVVEALAAKTQAPLSIDTSKAEVARQCLKLGAHVINDVTALTGDPLMPRVAKEFGAGVVLMHMQGTPATMQLDPRYDDVVAEVRQYLEARVNDLVRQGLQRETLAVDPGIGFGKKHRHNMELLARLGEFQRLGRPLCLGVSRKGTIDKIVNRPVQERVFGSVAIACHAAMRGAAQIIRVHDVQATTDALRVIAALQEVNHASGVA
jgi:dihydropteroate synthase